MFISLTRFICSCATCSQDHFNCPGHFGHIEIPIPAYNPMFFDNLYAILRAKCVYCHQFRISRALVNTIYIVLCEANNYLR
jgi:DNA-directed RNA polymerase I subunit RPA1